MICFTGHGVLGAVPFQDDFSNGLGKWTVSNNSDPIGISSNGWYEGAVVTALRSRDSTPDNLFATSDYEAADFSGTGPSGSPPVASAWLISPVLSLNNGEHLSFWTTGYLDESYPDRLQVRLNTNDTSANVGDSANSVGSFSTLLMDVNADYSPASDGTGYPVDWTELQATISGLNGPTDGRFAFRYFLTDGANQGNEIGVDDVILSGVTSVPEPGMLMGALSAILLFAGVITSRRTRGT